MKRAIGLLGSLLVASCGEAGGRAVDAGDGGHGGLDAADTAETQAATGCEAWAEATCERAQTCWVYAFNIEYGSTETCTRIMGHQCHALFDLPGVPEPTASATICAAATRNVRCELWSDGYPCTTAPGSLPVGAACRSHAQCGTSFCLFKDGLCGVCAPVPAAGADCQNQWGCGPDFQCVTSAVPGKASCIPVELAGAACGEAGRCGLNLICGSDGLCHPEGSVGDPCSRDLLCRGELACQDGRCQPRAYAKPGETCLGGAQCLGGVCDPDTNKCITHAREGEVCDDKGIWCEDYLICDQGHCQPVPVMCD